MLKTKPRPINIYIQQRDSVVDRINISRSEVIIGRFNTIKGFDWIKKINHALSRRNSHLKIEEIE